MHHKSGAFVSTLGVASLCIALQASASIVYTVNITEVAIPVSGITTGPETLTGTITTDGTIGALTASNFVSWSIQGSGTESFVVSSTSFPPFVTVSVSCGPGGCGVTATPTELDFTDGATAGIQFGTTTSFPFNTTITDLDFVPYALGPFASIFQIETNNVTNVSAEFAGTTPMIGIASASSTAPEPATLALVGVGLAGLGFARWRRLH